MFFCDFSAIMKIASINTLNKLKDYESNATLKQTQCQNSDKIVGLDNLK